MIEHLSAAFLSVFSRFTVISNIAVTTVAFIPGISPVYRSFLVVPNAVIMSIMGCRVYRNTKLNINCGDSELTLPMLNPVGANGNTIPLTVVQFAPHHTGDPLEQLEGDESDSMGNQKLGSRMQDDT